MVYYYNNYSIQDGSCSWLCWTNVWCGWRAAREMERWRAGNGCGPGHNTVLHSTAATLHNVGGKFVDKTDLAVEPATLSTHWPLFWEVDRNNC